MKRLVAGIGAVTVAAAVAGGAWAHAGDGVSRDVSLTALDDPTAAITGTSDGWTYSYDMDAAELVQSPARTEFAWAIPVTFGKDGETFSGTDFYRPSDGQANSVFINDDTGAYYATDHDPLPFPQWTPSTFYSPNGYDDLTDSNGKLGDWVVGSGLSWMLRPADYTNPITYADALDKTDFSSVLNLGPGTTTGDVWTPSLDSAHPVIGYQNLPMWSGQVTFGDGTDSVAGTDYMWSPLGAVGSYNQEFVTAAGAIYYDSPGLFGLTENLYYDPGDGGAVVDVLKTPLGDLNLSGLSWLFAPPDYSEAAPAVPDAPPFSPADLIEALVFGQTGQDAGDAAAAAATAADVLGSF